MVYIGMRGAQPAGRGAAFQVQRQQAVHVHHDSLRVLSLHDADGQRAREADLRGNDPLHNGDLHCVLRVVRVEVLQGGIPDLPVRTAAAELQGRRLDDDWRQHQHYSRGGSCDDGPVHVHDPDPENGDQNPLYTRSDRPSHGDDPHQLQDQLSGISVHGSRGRFPVHVGYFAKKQLSREVRRRPDRGGALRGGGLCGQGITDQNVLACVPDLPGAAGTGSGGRGSRQTSGRRSRT